MTLSFLAMPVLACFLIGWAFSGRLSWPYMWVISFLGLALFISAFWHIMRVNLWFILGYGLGPFFIGLGLPWHLSNRRRHQVLGLGIFFLVFFAFLYYLIVGLLNSAIA